LLNGKEIDEVELGVARRRRRLLVVGSLIFFFFVEILLEDSILLSLSLSPSIVVINISFDVFRVFRVVEIFFSDFFVGDDCSSIILSSSELSVLAKTKIFLLDFCQLNINLHIDAIRVFV